MGPQGLFQGNVNNQYWNFKKKCLDKLVCEDVNLKSIFVKDNVDAGEGSFIKVLMGLIQKFHFVNLGGIIAKGGLSEKLV